MLLRRLWSLLVFLSLCGSLCGCTRAPREATTNAAETPEETPAGTTTTAMPSDDLGRPVPLSQPARRVVAIGPGATEMIFAIGAGAKLVGRDSGSDYPAAAKQLPVAGDFNGPFPEKVVALRPDLVIVQGETYDKARAELWEAKIGAPVAVLASKTVRQVGEDIEKIGLWLGAEEVAAKIARPFLTPENMATNALGAAFFEVSRSPLWTAGPDTLVSDVLRHARLTNAANAVQGYKAYSLETLATQSPDFYVVTQDQPDRAKAIREVQAQPVVGRLACVRAGRVIVVESNLVLRPGPRLLQGIEQLTAEAQRLQTLK